MMKAFMSYNGCADCRECVDCCPQGAVIDDPNGFYVDFSRCNGCEICADICPNGSIEMYDESVLDEGNIY